MSELSKYGYIQEGKVYRYGFCNSPDREIGIVKDSEENSIQYFEERFERIKDKVDYLENNIKSAQNQGAYLQKLLHLKDQLFTFDALGDFESLYKRLEAQEKTLTSQIEQNKTRNLGLKTGLLEELEAIKASHDWVNASEQVKEIKNKWIKIGRVEQDREAEIENRFQQLMQEFHDSKKAFEAEKQAMYEARKQQYENLLQKAREARAYSNNNLQEATEQLKKLQKEWKETGYIPKRYLGNLWEDFKSINNEIFDAYKNQKKKQKNKDSLSNQKLNKLKELTEKAEELAEHFDKNAVEEAKKLNHEWKKTGFVKGREAKQLYERFKESCDKIFELNYLENFIAKKNRNYSNRTPDEQLKIKISSLKELITQEKEKYETFENNYAKVNFASQKQNSGNDNDLNKMFHSKFDLHKRRLITKEKLLKEMQEKLQQE